MPWEENRNTRSLSPHGLKEAQGFAQRGVHDINQVGCPEMPPGILGPTPLGATKSSPYMPSSSRPTRGAPQSMTPPHTASPHRYGADPGPRESDIITPRTKP
jgi:hypothetical protein